MHRESSSLLNKKEVLGLTTLGNTTLYKLLKQELFPKPVLIAGTRRVAWKYADIMKWLGEQKS